MYQYDITFIIPAYNIGQYLGECLESIIMQTDVKKQIIIVNDGSTDNTIDVAMSYGNKYDYIKVINKKNEGVSITRNIGIAEAEGKYICFIDGDDYYLTNFAKEFFDMCEDNKLDVIRGTYTKIGDDYQEGPIPLWKKRFRTVMSGEEFLRYSICTKTNEVVPWLGFFRRDFLIENHLTFPKRIIFEEDQLFFLNALICENCKIMMVETNFYAYRIRQGSSTSKVNIQKKINDIVWITNQENNKARDFQNKYIYHYASASLSQVFPFYYASDKDTKKWIIRTFKHGLTIQNLIYPYSIRILLKFIIAITFPVLFEYIR